jgi:hypothetical protein
LISRAFVEDERIQKRAAVRISWRLTMGARSKTLLEKEDEKWKRRQKGTASTWGTWVRKTQAPIWKKFLDHEENRAILWNMDCNDEVRDHLKGVYEDVYINSGYFEGNEDIFVASFHCPWAMRDLYQYMVVLYRSLKQCDPVERYKHFVQELGYLEDADGRRLDFGFLLPEDLNFGFYVRPEDLAEWERQVVDFEGTFPLEEEQREPLSEEDLDYLSECFEKDDLAWEEYRTGKRGGGFSLEGLQVVRKR